MAERLRALLERPLDPGLARAVVLLALAASTGFAVLVLLGAVGRDAPHPSTPAVASPDQSPAPAVPVRPRFAPGDVSEGHGHRVAGQDRQDHPGTEAHRRALRESGRHRALQHVPYRQGAVTITLVGARGPHAILSVDAPTVALARRGYHRFLLRFGDPGVAYQPRFGASSGSESPDSRRPR